MEIPRTPIDGSSNLVSHGYDADSRKLHVEFKGGRVYEYSDVEPEKATEFADHINDPGKSAGSFFHANIRNSYPVNLVAIG